MVRAIYLLCIVFVDGSVGFVLFYSEEMRSIF
jgi:hypothetical protein